MSQTRAAAPAASRRNRQARAWRRSRSPPLRTSDRRGSASRPQPGLAVGGRGGATGLGAGAAGEPAAATLAGGLGPGAAALAEGFAPGWAAPPGGVMASATTGSAGLALGRGLAARATLCGLAAAGAGLPV